MNDNKLIEAFWRDCEKVNFSKEATVLFFHLLYLRRQNREDDIYLHPASLLSKIVNFSQVAVVAASDELVKRGYIKFNPANGGCSSGVYRFCKGEAKQSAKLEGNADKPKANVDRPKEPKPTDEQPMLFGNFVKH